MFCFPGKSSQTGLILLGVLQLGGVVAGMVWQWKWYFNNTGLH